MEDANEILEDHETELNTEGLLHLQEEKITLADDLLSDEDEVREIVQSSLIKEMRVKLAEVQLFVENIIWTPF